MNRSYSAGLILLMALICLPEVGLAQIVPGYLGKRNIISYRGLIGPSFQPGGPEVAGFSQDGDPLVGPDQQFNTGLFYENQLSFERVMTPIFSLRLSLNQQSFHFGSSLGSAPLGREGLRLDEFIKGSALGVELATRWYYKHYGPLGWYFEFHVGVQRVNYEASRFLAVDENGIGSGLVEVPAGSRTHIPFGIAWGYQRILQDKYVVGFGTQLTGTAINSSNKVGIENRDNIEELEGKVGNAAITGAASGRFFPFFFSIGYLL